MVVRDAFDRSDTVTPAASAGFMKMSVDANNAVISGNGVRVLECPQMSLRPILASFSCAVVLAACSTAGAALPGAQSVPATNGAYVLGARPFLGANAGSGVTGSALCPVAQPGFGQCHAIRRTDSREVSARDPRAFVPFYEKGCFQGNAVCYSPQDLWQAYNLPSTSMGAGQVVAVVDAHNDPSAESDLAMYRAKFGLAPCSSNDGCFRKVGQGGSSKLLPAGSAWRAEESLDLEMVSARLSQLPAHSRRSVVE